MATQPATCPYCAAPTFGMKFCTNCGAMLHTPAAQPQPLCPYCGAPSSGMQFCTNCGMRLIMPPPQAPAPPPTAPAPPRKEIKVSRKYGALRAVATIFRILGWTILAVGSFVSIATGVIMTVDTGSIGQSLPQINMTATEAVAAAVGGIILSVLSGLVALAFADLCSVLMDIEANTRVQAENRLSEVPLPQQ